jgi:hypothetical protein
MGFKLGLLSVAVALAVPATAQPTGNTTKKTRAKHTRKSPGKNVDKRTNPHKRTT